MTLIKSKLTKEEKSLILKQAIKTKLGREMFISSMVQVLQSSKNKKEFQKNLKYFAHELC